MIFKRDGWTGMFILVLVLAFQIVLLMWRTGRLTERVVKLETEATDNLQRIGLIEAHATDLFELNRRCCTP